MCSHAGDYVSEEVWYRVVQIVINRQEVQGYAAKTCFEVREGGREGGKKRSKWVGTREQESGSKEEQKLILLL